jgi:hypothetical protein
VRKTLGIVVVIAIALCIGAVTGRTTAPADETTSATTRGVQFHVPDGWTLVVLSPQQPCAPQQTNIVIVAEDGLGGDCRAPLQGDAVISATQVNPFDTAPPTFAKVGELGGWQKDGRQGDIKRWVAVVPDKNLQLTFTGRVDESTRNEVIDSMKVA